MIPSLAQVPVTPTPTPEIAWSLIWPFVVLSLGGVLLITITSVVPRLRGNGFPASFTAVTAAIAAATLFNIWDRVNGVEGPQLVVGNAIGVDGFTVFVTLVICIAVFFASMLLDDYLRRENLDGPEWYVLLLMSAAGGVLLASAEDLIVTFIGLEVLSIAAYVMAALHLRRLDSQEAGFKYFLLGALASAVLLYGIALVYGATGSTSLQTIAIAGLVPNELGISAGSESSMILVGMAFLLVGFAFKVSAAPFHFWTPDVYQGSPTPVVAFMASGIKVAGFAGMVRVFWVGFGPYFADWRPIIFGLAIITLIIGSLLALAQRNVKRMLAYSSITHAGFILVAVYAAASPDGSGGILGGEAFLFYLFTYTVMVAGTFGVVTVVGGRGDGNHDLDDYRGLSKRQPLLALMMAALLFSQAGVPFTSGFIAKFRVIAAVASEDTAATYTLAAIAMLTAVVSAVLYLRIVVSMFLVDLPGTASAEAGEEGDEADTEEPLPRLNPALSAVMAVSLAAFVTILFGLVPDLGGDVLTDAAESLDAFRLGS
ncbi:MAG: NADH-quinone oxidoreductase subunit N [Actinomycetota bacterium]